MTEVFQYLISISMEIMSNRKTVIHNYYFWSKIEFQNGESNQIQNDDRWWLSSPKQVGFQFRAINLLLKAAYILGHLHLDGN